MKVGSGMDDRGREKRLSLSDLPAYMTTYEYATPPPTLGGIVSTAKIDLPN